MIRVIVLSDALTDVSAQTFYPVIAFCYFVASSWTWDTVQVAYRRCARDSPTSPSPASTIRPSSPPTRTAPPYEKWYTRRALYAHAYQTALPLYFYLISMLLTAFRTSLLDEGAVRGSKPLACLVSGINFGLASFIDGYYCFDLVWKARGWGLERRAATAEQLWSYLVAFGVPSTLISYFHPSGLLNMMLFMLGALACLLPLRWPAFSSISYGTPEHSSYSGRSPISPPVS